MAEYDVFTRINEHYAKMSKGHKAIADYISEHYDQAVFMTAAKLGETLGISESTVVRFAAGIGYDGYPKFQKAFSDIGVRRGGSVRNREKALPDRDLAIGSDQMEGWRERGFFA